MAEHVQAVLDRMVPGLAELQKENLLSADEVTLVVSRRRDSEYALRRRSPRLSDTLAYLTAETILLRLVQLREGKHRRRYRKEQQEEQQQQQSVKALQRNTMEDNSDSGGGRLPPAKAKRVSSQHILQFLHLLWVRTLRKYRSHLDLFHQYASFCLDQASYTRLAACYQDALRFHAHSVDLWIAAASHEYFHRHSLPAARILLQRAIRLHPSHAELWHQRWRLELHAAQKFRGRRAILRGDSTSGSNEHTTDDAGSDEVDGDGDAVVATPSKETSDIVGGDRDNDEDFYTIARLIYDQAITAIPRNASVSWRLDCLRTCAEFPDTTALQQRIVDSLQSDEACVASPMAWIARAVYYQQRQEDATTRGPKTKRHCTGTLVSGDKTRTSDSHPPTTTECVLDIIREACETLPTEDMFLAAVDFLDKYVANANDDDEKVQDLIHSLFVNAKKVRVYHDKLALRHANYLEASLSRDDWDDENGPITVLNRYVQDMRQQGNTQMPSASVWTRLAGLNVVDHDNNHGLTQAILILQRACRAFPMHHYDHAIVYGQLFCVYVEDTSNDRHPRSDTLQQLLILSTKQQYDDMEYPVIQSMPNLYTAIRQYLLFSCLHEDKAVYRKNCDALMSSTNFLRFGTQRHTNVIRMILEDMIDGEEITLESSKKTTSLPSQHRLVRIYDTAIQIFQGHFPDLANEFRQLKADRIMYQGSRYGRPKDSLREALFDVPSFDLESPEFDVTAMEQMYQTFQIVQVKNAGTCNYSSQNKSESILHWHDIGSMFKGLDAKDKASWSIETMTAGNSAVSPLDFLAAETTPDRAYCSFLVQSDTKSYSAAIKRLPFQEFPSTKWEYEPALWVFFCRNPLGHAILDGRPEHTDAITHDGTWHFQLSGKKQWLLRPTDELITRLGQQGLSLPSEKSLQIDCNEGDVIVVNTKLWFHHTMIPPQGRPSVSYARDFSIGESSSVDANSVPGAMTNLDGLYATNDISTGSIVFTESDMPNCALHRSSTNSNCAVVELQDGTNAVVATRAISAGEFFCVPESSEDEDCEGEDNDSDSE